MYWRWFSAVRWLRNHRRDMDTDEYSFNLLKMIRVKNSWNQVWSERHQKPLIADDRCLGQRSRVWRRSAWRRWSRRARSSSSRTPPGARRAGTPTRCSCQTRVGQMTTIGRPAEMSRWCAVCCFPRSGPVAWGRLWEWTARGGASRTRHASARRTGWRGYLCRYLCTTTRDMISNSFLFFSDKDVNRQLVRSSMVPAPDQQSEDPGSIPGGAALCFFFCLIQLSVDIFVREEKESFELDFMEWSRLEQIFDSNKRLRRYVQRCHAAYQNTLPDHSWIKLYGNIKVSGLVGRAAK